MISYCITTTKLCDTLFDPQQDARSYHKTIKTTPHHHAPTAISNTKAPGHHITTWHQPQSRNTKYQTAPYWYMISYHNTWSHTIQNHNNLHHKKPSPHFSIAIDETTPVHTLHWRTSHLITTDYHKITIPPISQPNYTTPHPLYDVRPHHNNPPPPLSQPQHTAPPLRSQYIAAQYHNTSHQTVPYHNRMIPQHGTC